MIKLNAEKIRDFHLCKYLYKAKHIDNIDTTVNTTDRDTLHIQLEDAIEKTIKYFYFETMSGSVPSFKNIIWKFERLWLKEKDVTKIVKDEDTPGKNIHHFTTEGIRIINEFYKRNYNNPGRIIILSEKYEFPLTNNLTINGEFDIVIEKNNEVIMPKYSMRGKQSFQKGALEYYKMVLDSMAYRYRTNKVENKIEIVYIRNGYTVEEKVISDLVIRQVKDITKEIEISKVMYPSFGNYWCKNCKLERYCSSW